MGILGAAGAADQWREIEAEALRQALLKRESARQDEELKLRQTELAENRAWRQDERNYRRQQEADAEMEAAFANAPLNGADRLQLTPEMQAWVTAKPSRVAQYQPTADMTLGSRQFGSAAEAAPPAQGGLAAPAAALGEAQYSAPQATGTMSINPMSRAEMNQRAATARTERLGERTWSHMLDREGIEDKRATEDRATADARHRAQMGLSYAGLNATLAENEERRRIQQEALDRTLSPVTAAEIADLRKRIAEADQAIMTLQSQSLMADDDVTKKQLRRLEYMRDLLTQQYETYMRWQPRGKEASWESPSVLIGRGTWPSYEEWRDRRTNQRTNAVQAAPVPVSGPVRGRLGTER